MKATLLDIREIAPNVRHFVFEVPEVKEFYFVPGQFVSLTHHLGGKEITRPYSIASMPGGNRFDLCLNLVEDGIFSPWLFSLRPGDEIETTAPLGFFVLRNPQRDAVFVATGTGIAPIRSMLEAWLVQNDDARQLTLIFGVRYEYGLLYRDELEELARKYPNFRFWPTLSRPEPSWTGRTGHVQGHLAEAVGERRDVDVYICGLKAMVDDVRAQLKGDGVRSQADHLREIRLMNRTVTLTLAMVVVFAATAAILSQILPGPHKPSDYLVMGGVATLFCLVLLFVVLIAGPGRGKDK